MSNGGDSQDHGSNVVSLAGVRRQAKTATVAGTRGARGGRRPTVGQWMTSVLFVALAVGGMFALAAPLLRAAGIVGG